MPRLMSFAMTTPQFIDRSKTVTRRFAWWSLKTGDELWGVKKAMGLKKGEKVDRLGLIRVVSTRREPLNEITPEDCVLEGFPDLTPAQFTAMLVAHYRCDPRKVCNRIEFEYA